MEAALHRSLPLQNHNLLEIGDIVVFLAGSVVFLAGLVVLKLHLPRHIHSFAMEVYSGVAGFYCEERRGVQQDQHAD